MQQFESIMPPPPGPLFNPQQAYQSNYIQSPVIFSLVQQPFDQNTNQLIQQQPQQQQQYSIPNSSASILSRSTSTNMSQYVNTSYRYAGSQSNRPFTNRTNQDYSSGGIMSVSSSSYSLSSAVSHSQTSNLRRTRRGHVSKTRMSKRTVEVNLHKSCPGCCKLWKNCKCSNIKNRPDPKPYCKFIPPRMLKKQNN